jgi:hypothetical protein
MPTDYQILQQRIAAAEEERWAAQRAEQQRLAAEEAARRKIAEKDAELARMKQTAARMELDQAIERARALNGPARAAVVALRDEMDAAISDLLERLAAPLAAADLAYKAVIAANDSALAAGLELSNHAPPLPNYGPNGAPVLAAEEHQRSVLMESYGRARTNIPAPYTPDQAALIGMMHETDPQRRRAWSALHYILTGGRLVDASDRYSPDDDAQQREKARTRPHRLLGM